MATTNDLPDAPRDVTRILAWDTVEARWRIVHFNPEMGGWISEYGRLDEGTLTAWCPLPSAPIALTSNSCTVAVARDY